MRQSPGARPRTLLLALGLAACGSDSTAGPGPEAATTAASGTSSGEAGSSSTAEADGSTGTGAPDEGLTGESGASTSSTSSTSTTSIPTTGEDPVDGTSTGEDTGSTGAPLEPVVPGSKIKVMTFNIRVGTAADGEDAWDKRKPLVYQVFEDQDADFVGVQEALNFQLNEIDAAVAGYKRIGVGTEDGGTKGPLNAIYYRKSRFMLDDSDTFWLSDTPNKPGSVTWGNKFPRAVTWGHFVDKDTTFEFYVYNTHFDHVSQNSREKGAALLMKKIAARAEPGQPFVVTGDFNAGEANLATRFLKGDAKIDGGANPIPLLDSFRVVKPDADNVGTAHGFNGGTGGAKIDYVWVPPDHKVTGASIDHFNVDGRYPSDHFPVIGTIKFAAQE